MFLLFCSEFWELSEGRLYVYNIYMSPFTHFAPEMFYDDTALPNSFAGIITYVSSTSVC